MRRKLIAVLALSLVAGSAVFLVSLVALYRDRLMSERSAAASQVYGLLKTTLENAMLKRDIDGLRDIVARLGTQTQVERVMILEPGGEVRFASDSADLGRQYDLPAGGLCPECKIAAGQTEVVTAFIRRKQGEDILRNVVPVANQARCEGCHGEVTGHPVNGILVVDYHAGGVREAAIRGRTIDERLRPGGRRHGDRRCLAGA